MLHTVLKYSLFLNLPILKAGTERYFDECEHVKCEFQNSSFIPISYILFSILLTLFLW